MACASVQRDGGVAPRGFSGAARHVVRLVLLVDRDLPPSRRRCPALRQPDGEDALVEVGSDLLAVDGEGQGERALERAVHALLDVVLLLLPFLDPLLALLAAER